MNSKVQYYIDLSNKKIDKSITGFVARIDAIHRGDWERVEFLDKCVLEPLDKQVNYLANKVVAMLEGASNG